MEEVKHMVRTVAVTTKGPWDGEKQKRLTPTTTTVRVKSRKLLNSYERKYNTEIPRGIKDSMAPWIEGELAKELKLRKGKDGHKDRKFFTIENYVQMQSFHWSEDFHDYIHEGMRADYTNLLNTHCYTSARLREVCQAVYGDLEVILASKDGIPEFRLKFAKRICKGTEKNQ
ncbi:hypothetical protein M441DRAFT_70173 [Trichoderma asperellum CBS 433.97]|uniref:Uncharacterized protein n=1 Tax=Trichoderma asperellum (strain ATCC 204424 / CBS 433.97 / NBRC 101777) TaxID=1042311 RepID=A0A2T3Z6H3_TRIA4|nr:hypothetical protein M441DRAFT_70173 [Trichoderma asperellum CBS 433.97]PTB40350.1 hypothetical protein M441DRAFT_70173 [Trichoderma asperellum CBS 433.97]